MAANRLNWPPHPTDCPGSQWLSHQSRRVTSLLHERFQHCQESGSYCCDTHGGPCKGLVSIDCSSNRSVQPSGWHPAKEMTAMRIHIQNEQLSLCKQKKKSSMHWFFQKGRWTPCRNSPNSWEGIGREALDPGQTQLTEERDKLQIKKGQTTHTEANLLSLKNVQRIPSASVNSIGWCLRHSLISFPPQNQCHIHAVFFFSTQSCVCAVTGTNERTREHPFILLLQHHTPAPLLTEPANSERLITPLPDTLSSQHTQLEREVWDSLIANTVEFPNPQGFSFLFTWQHSIYTRCS